MTVLTALPRPFYVLAPMDDVTDAVFRQMVRSCAPPDVVFTEFANVDGLQSPGRPKLVKKLRLSDDETGGSASGSPVIAQLWGKDPENFRKTAAELADPESELSRLAGGSFAGIDLNMGCPAKSEVSNGTCSALINNRPLAHDIIEATRRGIIEGGEAWYQRQHAAGKTEASSGAGRLSLSVKTRLGFNAIDHSWLEFLLKHDLDMLTVHGRTRKEMSKVPARWDEIGRVRQARDRINPMTLIVGNGDVRDRAHGRELAETYGLDGVMIGRGIFQDPYAFAAESPWPAVGRAERLKLYRRHVSLFAATWQAGERPVHTLNKFCKIYVNGFDGAKELREELMAAGSAGELLAILDRALA